MTRLPCAVYAPGSETLIGVAELVVRDVATATVAEFDRLRSRRLQAMPNTPEAVKTELWRRRGRCSTVAQSTQEERR